MNLGPSSCARTPLAECFLKSWLNSGAQHRLWRPLSCGPRDSVLDRFVETISRQRRYGPFFSFAAWNSSNEVKTDKKTGAPVKDSGEIGPVSMNGYWAGFIACGSTNVR